MVPGHEIVGRVISVGDNVKKFKSGDIAGVGCLVDSCRECENCDEGLEQHCLNGAVYTYSAYEKDGVTLTQGGYSSKIVVDERVVLKISEKLFPEKAAPLLCAGITTYSPLKQWNIGKGHEVAMIGLGGLGHMAVKFAAAFGADVTVLSTHPGKKSDAEKLSAITLLTTDEEQTKYIAGKLEFILDTFSAPHDYNRYLAMLKTGGKLICVGLPPGTDDSSCFQYCFKKMYCRFSYRRSSGKHRKCSTIAPKMILLPMWK